MDTALRPLILCVDDHEPGLRIRKLLLQSEGYAAITALTATEGCELFRRHPVDLVVLDYFLPDSDGGAAAAQMKRDKPEVPIILLSGAIDCPDDAAAIDAFISKADSPSTMLEKISELLKNVTSAVSA
jgi:CheY-like chemotaxis protein